MARFSPSDATLRTESEVELNSAARPIPSGPRNMATNLPRIIPMSIWNTLTPPKIVFDLRMLR